jgi:DNA-binding protein Fis
MLKGLFGKPHSRTKLEGAGFGFHDDDLLKYYVREYCLQRHICLKKLIDMMEREIIYQVLEEAHGNQRKAARLLGVRPNTLHYKIQRMGLVPVHKYMLPEEFPEAGAPDTSGRPEPAPWRNRRPH